MPFSKVAHAAALAKVAAAEPPEQRDAIQLGFIQGCHEMGLTEPQAARLGKFAAVVLDVAKPTEGIAKVAADFTGADTEVNGQVSADERLFRLQLEAQQRNIPIAQLAKQQGVDLKTLASEIGTASAPAPTPTSRDTLFPPEGLGGPDLSPPPAPKPAAPAVPKPPVKPAAPAAPKPALQPRPVAPKPAPVNPSAPPPVVPGAK